MQKRHRLATGIGEFDRVLGGGAMVGSLTLVAGDPGIGKSTLMTELGRGLKNADGESNTLLYVTGEESAQQVKLRAQRMGVDPDSLYLFPETNVEAILAAAYDLQPDGDGHRLDPDGLPADLTSCAGLGRAGAGVDRGAARQSPRRCQPRRF